MQSAPCSAGSTACARAHAVLVDQHQLAGRDLALELGADEVERAGLGGEHPLAVLAAPEAERPEAVRVAEADQRALRERDHRERAVEPRHRAGDRVLERRLVVRDQRRDQLGVGGRAERDALGRELLAQLRRVDEVAVVPERDRAPAAVLDQRLRVRPVRRAGRRVARVADRGVAVQAAQLLLVEDLRDEAHVAQHRQPAVVGDGDPGRLLAAVLQREEAEVGDARDVALRARGCRRRRTSGDRPELAQLRASRARSPARITEP